MARSVMNLYCFVEYGSMRFFESRPVRNWSSTLETVFNFSEYGNSDAKLYKVCEIQKPAKLIIKTYDTNFIVNKLNGFSSVSYRDLGNGNFELTSENGYIGDVFEMIMEKASIIIDGREWEPSEENLIWSN